MTFALVETAGVEPAVPKRRIYSPLGLPIFLHLQLGGVKVAGPSAHCWGSIQAI